MNLLFVHQNFPGQYLGLALHLAREPRHQVVSISERHPDRPINFPGIQHRFYDAPRGASKTTHHYIQDFEAAVRRGQAVAALAVELRDHGFTPDVICAHSGWGEALYLREVFPHAKLINYFEFFYRFKGSDVGFDPEYPATDDDLLKLPTKNTTQLLSFVGADAGITPTQWQRDLYPPFWRDRIRVIHDGIDTKSIQPDPSAVVRLEKEGLELRPDGEIVTYVSRNLEPYRGFHVFMRALPAILSRRPKAQVLIVGGDEVSYGVRLGPGENYRQKLLAEVGTRLDLKRVHFLGQIPRSQFLNVLQISTAHVYLTYPFVLSWSMLEAMAAGCLVVGSRTPPVEEVIQDGVNGLLTDFLSPERIADRVVEALARAAELLPVRDRARRTIVERYDWQSVCLPQHVALMDSLASR